MSPTECHRQSKHVCTNCHPKHGFQYDVVAAQPVLYRFLQKTHHRDLAPNPKMIVSLHRETTLTIHFHLCRLAQPNSSHHSNRHIPSKATDVYRSASHV